MRSIRDRIVQLEAGPQTGIRWAESGAKALEHDPPAPSPAAAASEPSPHVSHYEGDDMDPSALLPADSDPLEFA